MRKLYAVILIMILLMMTGCGDSADQTSPTGGSSSADAGAVSAGNSEDGAQTGAKIEEQSGSKQETDAGEVMEQRTDAGVGSGIAADSAAKSGQDGPAEMYAAYLKTLQAEKDMILAYDWQMRSVKDYGQESNWIRQPIAVTDITGDELPELIYVAGQQNPGTGDKIYVTRLLIDTWRNGRLENLYSDTWDIQAGGGFYYCLFRENTGKTLYAYASFGDENWTDEISFFKEENGKLTRSSHLCLKQGPEPEDYNRTYKDYYLDGSSVSEAEYQKELDALHAGLTEIVMFSSAPDDVMRAAFDRDGALSMSYADAEQYLLSQGAAAAGGKASDNTDGSAGGTDAQDPSAIFADLPSEFWFSSGAGGWSTDMKMNADGSFYGSFHDSNMGDIGADYPNGTVEVCNFTGRFTDVQKTGTYEYSMKLADLTYENPVDTSSIQEGVRYHYTDAYGLEGGGTFLLYLPGAPTAGMPQEFLDWLAMPRAWSSIPSELPCYGLYNVNTQCGFSGEKDTSSGVSSDSSAAGSASVNDGQILPESSTRLLTDADLAGLSSDQIQLAINEIYARHGYNFKKDEIRRWFFQYDWYSPVTDNMDQITASFSNIEKKNVDFLQGHK